MELIFTGKRPGGRGRPVKLDVACKTKVVTRGTDVTISAFFKHSRVKQYLKDGRALRIETVVNSPNDLGCQRRLRNLGELQAKARDAAVGHRRRQEGSSPAFRRPSGHGPARRPVSRAQRPRVHPPEPARPGEPHARRGLHANQMSYDLARLRLNGLIDRIEHTNTYLRTPQGQRVAVFYTKVHDRLLRPLLAANAPPAPPELRHALTAIDRHVRSYIDDARLGNAA